MRVLAISPSHDASVAVYKNGQIEFFAKEERLSRYKRDGLPFKSLEKVYEIFKTDIDYATYAWLPRDCSFFPAFHAYVHKIFGYD